MFTMYGPEAKDGDYVLVQDVQYMQRTAEVYVAQVRGDKAYAAAAIRTSSKFRWLRKESAIAIFPADQVSELKKSLIQMNIDAEKAGFESNSEYGRAAFQLIADVSTEDSNLKVATYGEAYRYR